MRPNYKFSGRSPPSMHLICGLAFVQAQTATRNITGVVKDEQGAVVPGANVKVVNIGTNAERTTVTSGDGNYELTQLVPGNYRLEVESTNFAKYTQDVTVNVLSRVTIDPQLRPAGATAQVTVTGENTPLIETTKTEVSGLIDQRQMETCGKRPSFASLATFNTRATLQPSFDPTKAESALLRGGSTGRNLNHDDGGDNKDNAVGASANFSMEGIQELLFPHNLLRCEGRSGGALLSVSRSQARTTFTFGLRFLPPPESDANAPALIAELGANLRLAGQTTF